MCPDIAALTEGIASDLGHQLTDGEKRVLSAVARLSAEMESRSISPSAVVRAASHPRMPAHLARKVDFSAVHRTRQPADFGLDEVFI
jgi:hypothetical protein